MPLQPIEPTTPKTRSLRLAALYPARIKVRDGSIGCSITSERGPRPKWGMSGGSKKLTTTDAGSTSALVVLMGTASRGVIYTGFGGRRSS